ncbi:ABC transporter permease [Thalassobaculum fulvum]|uniref:ABC transporter permease n=1 Tax=Thalassobaculum fulvum TaxID=1633335 RepID=A0A918XU42_9PROT|nr:ABC transporter permease [Thalassobaculum fulvum]GHD56225.1 ABC transporter permease [Thalassobaculum fulvum]
MSRELPRWIDVGLIPAVNILLAFLVAGAVVLVAGENPLDALSVLVTGAFGYDEAIGYTLYYATNLVFTGLAVAVAFHAGLFNIGGEGQAYIGGLGVGLVALGLDAWLPGWALIPVAIAAAGLSGAAWAFLPGWLQAHRGSHVVITTIMFNFLASALMVHLMVNVLIQPGQMSPESREFEPTVWLPFVHEMLGAVGIPVARSPLNLSILWAALACVFVWLLIYRTRWGYAIRTVGHNEPAAVYAGIDPKRVVVVTMCISGALAGFVGINEILGVHHRLLLNFTAGYGFTGIAVALMGRAHPVGIVLASLLFGALYQGGTELDFEFDNITRDMVVVIQGLVILFSGALAYMLNPLALRLWRRMRREDAA